MLEVARTNKREWQSQSILTRILLARRVGQESYVALIEGRNRWQSRFGHHPQTSLDEREEKGVDNIDKEQSEDRIQGRESQLHCEKHTRRKNSRRSSHEDKVEMKNIMSE